jgi:sugar O-acyltransferase (sialic acid O-acetyltransferase NeuD family)
MENIAIYGAGGFGREIACLIHAINKVEPQWNIIGFFDDNSALKGSSNNYGEILGGINSLNTWSDPLSVVMAIGNPKILKLVVNKINNPNIKFPNIVAPDVLFLDKKDSIIGQGNLISFRCVISCHVQLGNFNLLNIDGLIGHDSSIGDYNVLSPNVRISGEVKIGSTNFFGVSSVVLQQKKIGNNTTIATNSVIMRNTADNCTYIGNPAIKFNL